MKSNIRRARFSHFCWLKFGSSNLFKPQCTENFLNCFLSLCFRNQSWRANQNECSSRDFLALIYNILNSPKLSCRSWFDLLSLAKKNLLFSDTHPRNIIICYCIWFLFNDHQSWYFFIFVVRFTLHVRADDKPVKSALLFAPCALFYHAR